MLPFDLCLRPSAIQPTWQSHLKRSSVCSSVGVSSVCLPGLNKVTVICNPFSLSWIWMSTNVVCIGFCEQIMYHVIRPWGSCKYIGWIKTLGYDYCPSLFWCFPIFVEISYYYISIVNAEGYCNGRHFILSKTNILVCINWKIRMKHGVLAVVHFCEHPVPRGFTCSVLCVY